MFGGVGLDRYLVRPPVALDLEAVNIVRAGPALGSAQDDHRPARAGGVAVFARIGLIGENLLYAVIKRLGHGAVHGHGVAALDEVRLPAAAVEESFELFVRDAGKDGRVGYLVAIEVQYGQHRAVGLSVDELVELPAGGQRSGLCLAVADDAGHDELRVVGHGAEGVGQGVAQLTALVDGARSLGRDVAGHAAGEGKLLEEALHALFVAGDIRINFLVAAVQPVLGDHGIAAVARAGDVNHVEVKLFDNAVEVGVDEVLPGYGAPMAHNFLLDVLFHQRLLQQGVVQKIELARGEIVGSAPILVHAGKQFLCRGGSGLFRHRSSSLATV